MRPLTHKDLQPLYEILQEPKIFQYFPRTENPSMDRVQKIISFQIKQYEKYCYGTWAVELRHEPKLIGEFDPRLCGMVLENRGEPVSVGAGAACLGSPITSTLWLATVMARVGRPLRAGDIVLSGALGPMAPVVPGDVVEARIEGLGSVRASFAAG